MPDVQEISEALSRLFLTYPGFQTDDIAGVLKVYFEAVSEYETQDILNAVHVFIIGAAPGHNAAFAPSAPQLGAMTRAVRDRRLDHERLLQKPALPEPPIKFAPGERERVVAMAEAHIQKMTAAMRTDDAAADARMRDLTARTHSRFQADMSDAAVRNRLRLFDIGDSDAEHDAA